MPYNTEKHHRRSIRLKDYDYSQSGCYFITLCVQNRDNLFGKIVNGEMQLNQYGLIAQEEWERTPVIRKNVSLGEYIVMPDHFHAVVHIDYQIKSADDRTGVFKSPSHTIGAIIRGYKGATTKRIKELIRTNQGVPEGEDGTDSRKGEDGTDSRKGEDGTDSRKGEDGTDSRKGEDGTDSRKGELQFAPTKSIWQRDYWEHIIRNENAYHRISQYIINNPKKWEADKLNGKRAKP